jgi:hypothetical protein
MTAFGQNLALSCGPITPFRTGAHGHLRALESKEERHTNPSKQGPDSGGRGADQQKTQIWRLTAGPKKLARAIQEKVGQIERYSKDRPGS